MASDSPSLSTYEQMVDVEFDLADQDLNRAAINRELEALFES